jgi:hypothetical protein
MTSTVNRVGIFAASKTEYVHKQQFDFGSKFLVHPKVNDGIVANATHGHEITNKENVSIMKRVYFEVSALVRVREETVLVCLATRVVVYVAARIVQRMTRVQLD